jgi:hypothetical protein
MEAICVEAARGGMPNRGISGAGGIEFRASSKPLAGFLETGVKVFCLHLTRMLAQN